jgi:hypothetical protein
MKLRPPRTQAEVMRMLALYEPEGGLDALLARFDFGDLAPWTLQRIVLGQATKDVRPPADADPAAYCQTLLLSNPFRQFVLRNVLNAYPDKPRILFVHVPKCAGTDLTHALRERYFSMAIVVLAVDIGYPQPSHRGEQRWTRRPSRLGLGRSRP